MGIIFKRGDKVEVTYSILGTDWPCRREAIGHTFTLDEKDARRLNEGRTVTDDDNKYNINYRAEYLRIIPSVKESSVENIIKECEKRFPLGTKFKEPRNTDGLTYTRTGTIIKLAGGVIDSLSAGFVYLRGEYATIVTENPSIFNQSTSSPTYIIPPQIGDISGYATTIAGSTFKEKRHIGRREKDYSFPELIIFKPKKPNKFKLPT